MIDHMSNEVQNEQLSKPSKVWHNWLNQLKFLEQVEPKFIRMLVGFGYYLGAPIESDIWRINSADKENIINDYLAIVKSNGEIILSEPDPNREIFSFDVSVNGQKCWVNTDIVRMQVDATNISNFGLSNVKTICEIGGGYGQLALGFLNSNSSVSYTIVDFEQISKLVFRWVKYLDPHFNYFIYDNQVDYENNYKKPGLHLLPNHLLDGKNKLNFELGININSFCEMTDAQVDKYLKSIQYQYFYSNNRDRQKNNTELSNLKNILSEKFNIITPEVEAYANFPHKKKVLVCGAIPPPKIVHISDIIGITGKEMPAIQSS